MTTDAAPAPVQHEVGATPAGRVDLLWLPLGAGGTGCVRRNGRAFEALAAWRQHRVRYDLVHSALEVHVDGARVVIEMVPAWGDGGGDRGVLSTGPVGLRLLGRSRFFRYEVRRWRGGTIADLDHAIARIPVVTADAALARRLLALVPDVPTPTWGRDELGTGDMWNSNSLVSWLLARSGAAADDVVVPPGCRAPGWQAGLVVARRTVPGVRDQDAASDLGESGDGQPCAVVSADSPARRKAIPSAT